MRHVERRVMAKNSKGGWMREQDQLAKSREFSESRGLPATAAL
jgi:hypothetical protein